MNDNNECSYASNITNINEKVFNDLKSEKDETNSNKEKQIEVSKKNADNGILREQNFLNDKNGLDLYSSLHTAKNCTNTIVFNKKEKPFVQLNNKLKVCDKFTNNDQNEENFIIATESFLDTINQDELDIDFKKVSFNISSKESEKNEVDVTSITDVKVPFNNMTDSNETLYYAVYIPAECSTPDIVDKKEGPLVYTNKDELFKVMKINKKARFKQFKSKIEAEEFSVNGAEILSHEGSSSVADNEKIMPFKRPRTEEMIQFRKDIEKGDVDTVKEKIFENPKYLVSNGDTPSILQEGSRYNALHVAAKSKNSKIAELILDSITNVDFIGYLYDDNDIDSCISRIEILLDRYLNTPDKGLNETPLHLAVKHGATDVVQVLLSYSQCQKNIYNRYNELPKDIICSRVREACEETKNAIALMLDEQYFVPVLRSEDNSIQPKVGEIFSVSNPLKLEIDILSPRLEIQAYAGPMSKEKAYLFKKKWKTPSRTVKDLGSKLSSRLRDTEKGLEKTGRDLASELQVPWQEYWSFLDTFVNISSQKGLQMLENYLKNRFKETLDTSTEKRVRGNSPSKNSSTISDLCETFELCGSQEKETKSISPRSKRRLSLEISFSQRENCSKKESLKHCSKNPLVYVERSCEVFGKRIGAAISSCVLFENHAESIKECLETQIKHLLGLIKSYREDNRFQSVDFQLIHSRVAAVAVNTLHDVSKKDLQLILKALKEIDWSNGALSDDEDLIYSSQNYNDWSVLGVRTKQLHCLVKRLIDKLNDSEIEAPQLSPSARDEADCQMLWAVATPCECTWGESITKKPRGGLKRKQHRHDRNWNVTPKSIQFDEENEDVVELATADSAFEDSDDHFSTPTSGNSDSEEMQDVNEIPNTFIYPGSTPSKTDYAVLEAIEKVPIVPDKYPNIYLWRHILQLQPKLTDLVSTPNQCIRRVLNFDSPKSSPYKVSQRSFGSCEMPSINTTPVEPWERVIGPYSPRRTTRASATALSFESPVISR